MKLGTKLTFYLSLIIILVLSGYGYLETLSRREMLIRKMKAELRSMGRTLEVTLEKLSRAEEKEHIQDVIDALSEYERTLGVIVYYQDENRIFRSRGLKNELDRYYDLIQRSIRENKVQEDFGLYKKATVFSYTFPFKDPREKIEGGISILQSTSFLEREIDQAKWNIFITILVLILGTIAMVFQGTRKWVTQPISKLTEGIRNLAKGNLDQKIDLHGGDELNELAHAFNQMAVDLKKAQERIVREAETKLALERTLRQSEKLATIGQLASELAHELGTPLNIVHGRAELIQRKPEDQEGIKRNVEVILHQTERITKIIQQLLGMARGRKPEYTSVHITSLLETVLELLAHQIQRQGVEIVKDWGDNLPPLKADPDQLQQVFLNLLLNAIQSMPGGGLLTFSTSLKCMAKEGLMDQRPYMEVSVRDTGVGMGADVIQNLFNPFFTTKATGTGLGLMVSQGIIRDHEGWIEVESEVGKGSVFKVYLPVG